MIINIHYIVPFPTVKNVDVNSITKSELINIINKHIEQLCKDLIDQLRLCGTTKESTTINRSSQAEKCCEFYKILLDIKYAHTGN